MEETKEEFIVKSLIADCFTPPKPELIKDLVDLFMEHADIIANDYPNPDRNEIEKALLKVLEKSLNN